MKQRKFKFNIDCTRGPIHLTILDTMQENGYTIDQIYSFIKALTREGAISKEQEFYISTKIKMITEIEEGK